MPLDFTEVAHEALSRAQCCKKLCLYSRTASFEETVQLMKECREDIHNLDRYRKRDFIRDAVRACINGIHSSSECFCYDVLNLESQQVERLEINWKLKTKSRTVQGICRRAFCAAYDIGNTALTEICAEIKVSQIDSILCLYQIALLFHRL